MIRKRLKIPAGYPRVYFAYRDRSNIVISTSEPGEKRIVVPNATIDYDNFIEHNIKHFGYGLTDILMACKE